MVVKLNDVGKFMMNKNPMLRMAAILYRIDLIDEVNEESRQYIVDSIKSVAKQLTVQAINFAAK